MDAGHVLSVRDYFAHISLWPHPIALNPRAWLSNFDDVDKGIARHLLDGFVYMNSRLVDRCFHAAFRRLGTRQLAETSAESAEERWTELRDHALFSFPSINPTDSGHMFVRIMRDDFGVDEGRIYELDDLVAELTGLTTPPPVVLVDDFIGTGDQFLRTVRKPWAGGTSLLDEMSRLGVTSAHYVVAVASGMAKDRIESSSPFGVSAGNVLPSSSSLRAPNTHLVAPSIRAAAVDLVERYSRVAGIPEHMVWGYRGSGLAVSFEHKTPNNTLPLFTWKENGWIPLTTR